MAAPLIVFMMLEEIKKEHILNDINIIKNAIHEKVIKINLLIKNNILQGLIITTDLHIYNWNVDTNSIIPIVKYYGLYTKEFKQELDNYYQVDCCIII